MPKLLIIFFLFLLLNGCSTGRYVGESPLYQGESAAEVTVIRKYGYVGGAINLPLELDGKVVAELSVDNLIKFPVAPGKRFLNFNKKILSFSAEPGGKYYFLYEINSFSSDNFVVFKRLTAKEFEAELKKGDFENIEISSGK